MLAMPYLCWTSLLLGASVLAGLLFLCGCCFAHCITISWWDEDERPRTCTRHKSGRLGHRTERFIINTDALEYEGGTCAFYVSKHGTKVHLTDKCNGLGPARDHGTVQRKDVCSICFKQLMTKTQWGEELWQENVVKSWERKTRRAKTQRPLCSTLASSPTLSTITTTSTHDFQNSRLVSSGNLKKVPKIIFGRKDDQMVMRFRSCCWLSNLVQLIGSHLIV